MSFTPPTTYQRALVTGASGFLGRYLVEQLVAAGCQVRALCRSPQPKMAALGVEMALADIRQAEEVGATCQGMDIVFHTAAIAGLGGAWSEFYAINTLGTQHVVAGCLRHGVPKLVFTSSPSVTFDGRSQEGIDERAPYPTKWLAFYPRSKALAEQHVLASNGKTLATCALRPHLIWGPGDRHLVPRLLERARNGQLRRVGDGRNRIDTVFVENAALAHLQAAAVLAPGSPVAGRAYFISQGTPVNCWQWIDELLALADLPPVKKSIPLSAAWYVGGFLEGAYRLLRRNGEPRMTRFLAAQLGTSHWFDITRARTDFGYEPRIGQAEGMRRLAASWKAEQSGKD